MQDRITEIEIKLAHQEMTIETLNQVITQQQSQINQLLNKIELLNIKLKSLGEQNEQFSDLPPPHY